MNRIPKLDLSFSCDSVRSGHENKNDQSHFGETSSIASSSRNTITYRQSQHGQPPPYAVDYQRPFTATNNQRNNKVENQPTSGFFTPYSEHRTARKMIEREFTDLNIGRQIVEERLPEEDVVKGSKDVAATRPATASALSSRFGPSEPAKRVAFSGRLLVNSDADSLREFNGFYWNDDGTLAIYEFRGKGIGRVPPRVLPFVSRGKYVHAGGIRQGCPVTLKDIAEGRDIVLSVAENSTALNDALRQRSVFVFRVTSVDLAEKKSILLKDVRISDHDDFMAKFHDPETKHEADARVILHNVRAIVRRNLKNRGIPSLLNMRHELGISVKVPYEQITEDTFKKYCVSKKQITELLGRFSVNLNAEEIEKLCSILDADNNGLIDFGEFVRGIIGGMSEVRWQYVKRAWVKMDTTKNGRLSISTIRKFYSARNHPEVLSGNTTEQQIITAFAKMLQPLQRAQRFSAKGDDGEALVGFGEFETYYEGLSLAIDSDEDFSSIIKDTWGALNN